MQRLVGACVSDHGRLDLMFNNAGIVIVAEAREHTLEDWHQTLEVNLGGVIHGGQAAYPVMVEQGSGHIVNAASAAGLVPVSDEIACVAT